MCPLTCDESQCPVVLLLHAILDKVEASHQASEGKEEDAKKHTKATNCRLHVNRLVTALQIECPEKIWTSDAFAEEIGCTGAAVRKTKAWREYQERLEHMKKRHLQRKGFKDEYGNLEAFESGEGSHY